MPTLGKLESLAGTVGVTTWALAGTLTGTAWEKEALPHKPIAAGTRAARTAARLKPRLLVLDPFVRLNRIDENISGEVEPLLAFLRELQRRHGIAGIQKRHKHERAAVLVLDHHAIAAELDEAPGRQGGRPKPGGFARER